MKKPLLFTEGFLLGIACWAIASTIEPSSSPTPKHPFPRIQREGYTVVYDTRFKLPLYTYERLTQDGLTGTADRSQMEFTEDPTISKPHRSTLKDFYGSNFDRGHLCPAADQKSSHSALKETFYLTNICPQDPKLNRGWWFRLEKRVRNLTQTHDLIEVITGPLFLPKETPEGRVISIKVIGQNDVAVPTHFFKAIFMHSPEGRSVECYVVPNAPLSIDTPLQQMRVDTTTLEKWSGLQISTD